MKAAIVRFGGGRQMGKSEAARIACEEIAKSGGRAVQFFRDHRVEYRTDGAGGFVRTRIDRTNPEQKSDGQPSDESDGR